MAGDNGTNGSGTLALSKTESSALEKLETVIGAGLSAFVQVGQALRQIRDARLYRDGFDSFEAYCHERWNLSRPRVYQLIDAAGVVDDVAKGNGEAKHPNRMSTMVDTSPPHAPTLPENERQARALKDVPAAKRPEVWKEAVDSAPTNGNGKPKVTAAHVRRVAKEAASENGAGDVATASHGVSPGNNPGSPAPLEPAEEAMDETEPSPSADNPEAVWNAFLKDIIARMKECESLMRKGFGAVGARREGIEFTNPLAERLVNPLTTIVDAGRLRGQFEDLIIVRMLPDGTPVTVGDVKSRRASA